MDVRMEYVELIGCFSGPCTTISFLPQVIQVFKTRSVKDISLGMYTVFVTGVLGWLIYGILLKAPSVIVANALTLILASIILFLRIRWGRS
jgi:MtN3 and saliva related transmembrane protein